MAHSRNDSGPRGTGAAAAWAGAPLLLLVLGGCDRRDEKASETQIRSAPVAIPEAPPPFATPPVLPGASDVPALVNAVKGTVVNITTTQEIRGQRRVDPFEFFFGPRQSPGGGGGGDEVLKRRALGSGFILDAVGHVATNAHVVAGATAVRVKLSDGREFPAKVRGSDARLDLAVLELDGAKGLQFASLGSSDAVRVGEYAVAIGNPFGLGDTVTMGIVSAKGRELGAGPYDDFVQTDASINPGNSGGPLFNLQGQVIGINTAIAPEAQGIGFATPIDALKDILPDLLASGTVHRGRLGVMIQPVDAALAKALDLPKATGALISEVEPGSPASKAGLAPGEVIAKVDDTPIERAHDLPRMVARHKPGTKITLEVVGKKGSRSVTAVVDEAKDEPSRSRPQPGSQQGQGTDRNELGLSIAEDPRMGVVVTDVDAGGPAAGLLDTGDVIVEIDGRPVKTAREAAERLSKVTAERPALLRVRRDGRTRFVALDRKGQ